MKKTIVFIVAAFIAIIGCTKTSNKTNAPVDKCKTITCQNGGGCSGGVCSCPTGYTGTYCETKIVTTGTIQFVNNSSNPYNIYIAGVPKGTLVGKASVSFTIAFGTYECRVIQQSGYLVSPTDKTYTAIVSKTANSVVTFP